MFFCLKVPVGSYIDFDSMAFILNETEASVIVCSPDVMKKLEQLDSCSLPFLKAVIVMDMYQPLDVKARSINDHVTCSYIVFCVSPQSVLWLTG